jgi:hypothetical protein
MIHPNFLLIFFLKKLIFLNLYYYIIELSPGCHARNAFQDKISSCVIILLFELEEIIIFLEGNRFQVELNVGERGKYIRDANNNFA